MINVYIFADCADDSGLVVAARRRRDMALSQNVSGVYRPLRIHVHSALGPFVNAEQEKLLWRVVARTVTKISTVLSGRQEAFDVIISASQLLDFELE